MAASKTPKTTEVKRPRGRPKKVVHVENRGGRREGAGRKPTGLAKVPVHLYVSKEVKDLIPQLRERGAEPSAEFEKMVLRYADVLGLRHKAEDAKTEEQ